MVLRRYYYMVKKPGLLFIGLALAFTCLLSGCSLINKSDTTTTPTDNVTTNAPPEVSPFSDIPLYTKAKTAAGDYTAFTKGMSSTIKGVKTEWHYYEIDSADTQAAQDFYKTEMHSHGWTVLMDMADLKFPGMNTSSKMYIKGDDSAIIMTFPNPANSKKTILGIGKTSM
jgi:hypothetical protein